MPWHTLEPATKLRSGEVKTVKMGKRYVAIGRLADGFFAVDDNCPHAAGSLGEGMLSGDCVICPIHGYAYHVRSGEGMDDGEELPVFETRLEGDVLHVNVPGDED